MSARSPGIARWLLAAITEPNERAWILADLEEMYLARRPRSGRIRADLWYCSQVARSIPPLVVRRLQPGRSRVTISPTTAMPLDHDPARTEGFGASLYFLRHAVRRLWREPAFTIATVLTLALGVGGNVAVFAVVEAVLLRPLPLPNADRIVVLEHHDQRTGITKEFIPSGDYPDILARQQTFDAIGAYGSSSSTIFGADEPLTVTTLALTPAAVTVLGLRPTLGRAIEAGDVQGTGSAVIMVSYEYWRNKLGSNPNVVGTSLKVGQTWRTIVGVAPAGFRFRGVQSADLIVPMLLPPELFASRPGGFLRIVARLRAGRTVADATADLSRISQQLEQEYPASNAAQSNAPVPLRDILVGSTKPALVLLLAAVGVVLLIACVNVANLLLARSLARRREMAVRMALGAGRARLGMQLMSESLALAGLAGVAGVAFAFWGARALVALVPASVESPGLTDVHIDGAVLAFAVGITVITTLTFGVVTMLTVRLDGAAAVLVGGGRTSPSSGMRRTASTLVVAEVALAIVLLIGAGLIMRTFSGLLSVDPGFKYDRVMTIATALPADRYRDSLARSGFYAAAEAALRAVPGVESVGQAAVVPLTGNNWTVPFQRMDKPLSAGERPPDVGWQVATGGFFSSLGIPVVAGRLFDARDHVNSPPVVIVSRALAMRFFPNEPAVGKRLVFDADTAEIVGVVGDIRRAGLRDEPRPDLYFSREQGPQLQTTFFIRTAGQPDRALPSLQAALRSVESKLVFVESQSLATVAAESVRTTKLVLWLLGVFAATALVLAAVGIYGVMSYVVRQRTREIGTRMALGATAGDIVWLIMREGAAIAALGAALGLGIGLAAAKSLDALLFGVKASDPVTMGAATVVLVVAILAACYLPARRAAAVDPARTLAEQ